MYSHSNEEYIHGEDQDKLFDILGIQDLEKTYHVDLIYMNACSSPEVVHHKMFAIDSRQMKPSTGDDNFQKKVFGIMDFEGKMKIGIIADSFESLVDKGKDWKKIYCFLLFHPFCCIKIINHKCKKSNKKFLLKILIICSLTLFYFEKRDKDRKQRL